MRPAIHDASARQQSGGLSPVPGRGVNRNDRARKPSLSEVEAEIAGLLDRSTQELRLTWHKLHRTDPPLGLSRDLLIRSLAYHLQEHAHGGPSATLRRRMRGLAGDLEKGALRVTAGAARGPRAKDTKVGCACLKVITMAGSQARPRIGPLCNTAARRHHGGSRTRDKIRGSVADFITRGAVLE